MKKLVIILFALSAIMPAFSQVVTGEAPTNEKHKLDSAAYYRQKGSCILNVSNYMVTPLGVVSMPVNLNFDATVEKNLTLGVICTYLQMKDIQNLNDHVASVKDGNLNYNLVTMGAKASYHWMPLLQKAINKPLLTNYLDVYTTGWVGYSMTFAGGHNVNIDFLTANNKVRYGAGLGVRSMVLPRLGFFVEGGYGSFGYLSFGITTRLK